jgi:cytochrome bd-type quinol oxidase subunit 1
METALQYDRLQFAVTATFHYLFPQLTMGLALLLVYLRTRDLLSEGDHYHQVARFWTGIFALSFAFGVVTGIPLEFQFGTNWANFSNYAGGIVGQTLAMEGVFAFFLESSFLGLLLFGESRVSRRTLWLATVLLWLGSWLSGYFILATNAWMQHPVAYHVAADGRLTVESLAGLLTNPWLIWQFAHNMTAAVVTGAFVMAAVGALYQLAGRHPALAKTCLHTGVVAGAFASVLLITPTGHESARQVFEFQPVKGAAFEGLFRTERGADLVLIGQPNMETLTIDNPLAVPSALSLLVYDDLYAKVKGLDAFPPARVARPHCALVLRLSHHGRARHAPARGDGIGPGVAVAWPALHCPLVALAPAVERALSLSRDDGRLDDGGARPPTLAGVRALSHGGGHLAAGPFRQCALYLAGLPGNLSRVGAAVRPVVPGNPAPRADGDGCGADGELTWKRSGMPWCCSC